MTSREQAEEWAYQLEETGHHMLSCSDFGWWSCKACGKRGDDYDDPKDFKCVDIGTYEI